MVVVVVVIVAAAVVVEGGEGGDRRGGGVGGAAAAVGGGGGDRGGGRAAAAAAAAVVVVVVVLSFSHTLAWRVLFDFCDISKEELTPFVVCSVNLWSLTGSVDCFSHSDRRLSFFSFQPLFSCY